MLVESVTNYYKGRGRKLITFEDRSQVVLYPKEVASFGIAEGAEVSDYDLDRLYREVLSKRAKKRAMHLLEKMDRTESDIRTKLSDDLYPESIVDEAIDYLYSYHYLDDDRYARNYIRFHSQGKSKRLLRQELIGKGVDKNLAVELLDEDYDTDERELIRRELAKKHFDSVSADDRERRRVYSYLLRKGFDMSDILAVMRLEEI